MYSMGWWRHSSPECTPEDLAEIITKPTGGYYVLPGDPYNEVFTGLYIGDSSTALCTSLLRKLGITHVVNAAHGKDKSFSLVNTSAEFYKSSGIKFHGIEALDLSIFPIYPHFNDAAEFIHEALINNGKVLVHCGEGISRSATIVLAYLMIKRNFTAQQACEHVRCHRAIIPNSGFLKQLCHLNDQLNESRNTRKSQSNHNSQRITVIS